MVVRLFGFKILSLRVFIEARRAKMNVSRSGKIYPLNLFSLPRLNDKVGQVSGRVGIQFFFSYRFIKIILLHGGQPRTDNPLILDSFL